METRRLKNIAILILLLLNAFLLLLLGYQYLQAEEAARDTREQLSVLFASQELELSAQADLSQSPLSPLVLSRHQEGEAAMAESLLGGPVTVASQGGGIVTYTGEAGSIQFRSGGGFDGGELTRDVEDAAGFVREFCQNYGYKDVDIQLTGGDGSVTAQQYVAGVPIAGCGLTLMFQDGMLTAVSGAHISLEGAATEESEPLNCVTALVRFLDYRRAAGVVCSRVEDISCVYQLQSSPSSLRLVPLWRIDTDTYAYYVDCASGSVVRA